MAAEADAPAVTEDVVLGGRLRLRQPRHGHRIGHDAILLAAATAARPAEHAIELGAGVGAAGLALARRVPGLALTLVEVDPQLCALAAENTRLNQLDDRVRVLALDVGMPGAFAAAGLKPACVQRVLMNPPFHDAVRHNLSPDADRRLAYAAAPGTLPLWVDAAARLLTAGGVLTLIWRADELAAVMAALAHDFGAIAVLPVYSRPATPAIRVLVRAEKGSRAPPTDYAGLELNDRDGRPTPAAEAVLRHGELLALAGP